MPTYPERPDYQTDPSEIGSAVPESQPGAPDRPEGAAAANVETLPSLEEQLRQIEQKAAEHHDAWLRAKAEADNVRKRAQEDVAKAHRFGIEKFAAELLAVKDSLEAALATENATLENLRSGVDLTLRQLEAVFDKQAIREINPIGQRFDPHRHQ